MLSPARQDGHLPHDGMNDAATWSPTAESVDTFADLDDDAGAFMTTEHGERRHRDVAGYHVVIGMT